MYSRSIELTATELSLLWKATHKAKEGCKHLIKRQEQRKAEGKLEPGEGVPYDLLQTYEALEHKLYLTNTDVEDQVLADIKKLNQQA